MDDRRAEQKARILVIDDEPSVVDALKMILSDQGYDAFAARTGKEGLDLIDQGEFDLTVTDLRLPDMSGLDILSRIREKNPRNLVILITAHATPDTIAEAINRGVTRVLPKPFSPASFIELVHFALTHRS
jgi:DNA-binding NtrC family response regulator